MHDATLCALVIIDQKHTDDRLINTEYFKERKNEWFAVTKHGIVEKISMEDDRIIAFARDSDRELVNFVMDFLNLHHIDVLDHGWFDVNRVSTTYDFPHCSHLTSTSREQITLNT
jgi:hypothetical protein